MTQRARSPRIDLWLAATIVLAQLVLLAIETVVGQLGRAHAPFSDSSLAGDLVGDAGILAWAVTGLVVVARRRGNRLGWLFLVANLGWVLGNSATAVAAYSQVVSPLPAAALAQWLATWPGHVSIAVYVLIVLLFPDGTPISQRWRRLAWFVAGYAVVDSLLAAIAAGPIESLALEGITATNPIGLGAPIGPAVGDLVNGPLQPAPVILFAAATVSLVLRFRRSTGLERLQLKWLVAAVLATTALWVSIVPFMFAYQSLTTAPAPVRLWDLVAVNGSAVIPIAAAVAILRHRLYEIDRIVSRTVAWGTVSLVLVLVFAAAVVGLDDLLAGVTQGQTVAVAASTLVAFALFQPLRGRVQAVVDHRFDRARYDAQQIVDAFAEGLRGQVDLDQIHDGVLTAVAGTVRPRAEAIWLRGRR